MLDLVSIFLLLSLLVVAPVALVIGAGTLYVSWRRKVGHKPSRVMTKAEKIAEYNRKADIRSDLARKRAEEQVKKEFAMKKQKQKNASQPKADLKPKEEKKKHPKEDWPESKWERRCKEMGLICFGGLVVPLHKDPKTKQQKAYNEKWENFLKNSRKRPARTLDEIADEFISR